ncbi:MAG TPA: hypothetical protein VKL61_04890, partial [Candidatus Polarisedimenticolia bacterium]|nr:hypothetical protein [Candidatus Polarisedimenticolia bacterium]
MRLRSVVLLPREGPRVTFALREGGSPKPRRKRGAWILVTLRPSAPAGTPGDGRVRSTGRGLAELPKESSPSDLREEGRLRSVPVLFARINSRGLSRLL